MGVQNGVQKTANFNSRGSVRPFLRDPVFRRLVFRSFAQRSRRKSRKIAKSIEDSSSFRVPKGSENSKHVKYVVFCSLILAPLCCAYAQKSGGGK